MAKRIKKITQNQKQTGTESPKSKKSVNMNKASTSTKAIAYQQLRELHPDWTKEKCKLLAGYSVNTKAVQVEKSVNRIIPKKSREMIVEQAKSGYEEQLIFFSGVRDNTEEATSNRIAAARTINDMVPGHNAPKQIEQKSAQLIIELNKIPEGELKQFAEHFGGM